MAGPRVDSRWRALSVLHAATGSARFIQTGGQVIEDGQLLTREVPLIIEEHNRLAMELLQGAEAKDGARFSATVEGAPSPLILLFSVRYS